MTEAAVNLSAPDNSVRLPIDVQIHGDRVRKQYHRDALPKRQAEARFAREFTAYSRFNELGTDFVPQLLDSDSDGLWLDIELVAGGRTLIDWLNEAPHNSFEAVITQLLRIDAYLYEHRVNYLGGSPKDVMVADDYRLYLIDFEHTWTDERFEDLVCESMIHTRLARVTNTQNRDLFVAMLANRQREARHYTRRKIANGLAQRLHLGRRRQLVK